MSDMLKKTRSFERDNLAAAAIIAADPERYPGLPQEWVRLFMTAQSGANPEPGKSPVDIHAEAA